MSTVKTTNLQHPSAANPAIELTAAGQLWLAGRKILQIVRATDTTDRSTTSNSFQDVTGLSVTITPQKSDSAIFLTFSAGITVFRNVSGGDERGIFALTDSSNNILSTRRIGRADGINIFDTASSLQVFHFPATTSATTYKIRFRTEVGGAANTIAINGSFSGPSELYAIEVSA